MTVGELIREMRTYDQDAVVVFEAGPTEDDVHQISSIYLEEDDQNVAPSWSRVVLLP